MRWPSAVFYNGKLLAASSVANLRLNDLGELHLYLCHFVFFFMFDLLIEGVNSNKYTSEVFVLIDTAEVERKHESILKKSFLNRAEAVLVKEHLDRLIGKSKD